MEDLQGFGNLVIAVSILTGIVLAPFYHNYRKKHDKDLFKQFKS